MERREEERRARRRDFVTRMAPVALALFVVGVLLAVLTTGFPRVFGMVVAVSGLGALAALIPLAFGNDPDSKE